MSQAIKADMEALKNPEKAKILQGFFKTGKGEYGEGDIFLGLTVPQTRSVAKKYKHLELPEVKELLLSRIHEHRLAALLVLVEQFSHADDRGKKCIYDFYIKHASRVNNWDLVDLSAPNIAGRYLADKNKKALYSLAKSKNLWENRISIVATYAFIKNGSFEDTLQIAELLLADRHDLIHKAVGWMLREVGKRNQHEEEAFLQKHYKKMPRTMLRYAIERFEKKKKAFYMKKTFRNKHV